jgi:hypothetical protein
VNSSARDNLGTLFEAHGPFVPDLGLRVVSPDTDLDSLSISSHERFFDREVEGEPRVHARGVGFRFNAVVNLLIQFSCEISSEPVYLALLLLDGERE